MGLGLGRDWETEADHDTIYYIKTSKPHIHDVTMVGPFYPLEHVLPQLLFKVKVEKSTMGERVLDDIVYGGHVVEMRYFTAPLPDCNIMKFEIIREKNAEVARTWPSEVWVVMVAEPFMDMTLHNEGHPQVDDMHHGGTFRTKEQANEAAEELIKSEKELAGDGAQVRKVRRGELTFGMVIPRGGLCGKMIEVRREIGETIPIQP